MEMRNDYATSFNDRTSQATGTFGRSNAPVEMLQKQENDKKAWKMDFSMGENEVKQPKDQKKSWKMDFNNEDEGDNTGNSRNKQETSEEGTGQSLAELFQKNRKKMIEKYENQKDQREKAEVKEVVKPRTKEEILKQRKAMMEYQAPLTQKARQQNAQANNDAQNSLSNPFKERKSSKDPKPELLDRLALGQKAKVSFKKRVLMNMI